MTRESSHRLALPEIQQALRAPLPGWPAQSRMLALPRATRPATATPQRESAVLLALFARQGNVRILLTRRSERIRHHKGQIALPGGACDPTDLCFWATALREAEEEVGLQPTDVLPLGALTPLDVPTSNFSIHPLIGWLPAPPTAWRLAPDEVAEVIELPLETLHDLNAQAEETWSLPDRTARVPFYRYQHHRIWGATAMILSELQVLLAALKPSERGAA